MAETLLMLVEVSGFDRSVTDYFGGDDAYAAFQSYLAANPDAGDVMPGCGGVRKVRWTDPRRGSGKRGGLRVIYIYVPLVGRILLLDVYHKGEAEDLTPGERKFLAQLAEEYRQSVLKDERTEHHGNRH